MIATPRRAHRFLPLILAVAFLLLLRNIWKPSDFFGIQSHSGAHGRNLSCDNLPGAEDVLLVLKTGATEALDKVPIHFQTTFRCVPHYVIYSDFGEEIEGHPVYDVLADVSKEIKSINPDFVLYTNLRINGRAGLGAEKPNDEDSGQGGKLYNPGWKLDKWKFLPMIDKALQHRPNATWYVFMETDTILIWSNLLRWLAELDGTKPCYLGEPIAIDDVVFGYGGSGFIISNSAMRKMSEHRATRLKEYDEYTAGHWAGDCVLGKTMADAGVPLTWSWPLLQGEQPSTLNHLKVAGDKRIWCYPVITYHHVTIEEEDSMWHFEQQWLREQSTPFRHSDVFEHYVLPKLAAERDNWDNLSTEEVTVTASELSSADPQAPEGNKGAVPNSADACRIVCEKRHDCLQYSYALNKCRISNAAKLGHENSTAPGGFHSGWMLDRIKASVRNMEPCPSGDWVIS